MKNCADRIEIDKDRGHTKDRRRNNFVVQVAVLLFPDLLVKKLFCPRTVKIF